MTHPVVDDKYELFAPLGEGPIGTVWEARRLATGARVALKLLHPEFAADRAARTAFLTEARRAARLSHPNVAEILDVGQAPDGAVYVVTELLHGETLAEFLDRRRALPFREGCELLLQVLAALGAAHAREVIHRHLRPSNVFVVRGRSSLPAIKVLDFGLAAAVLDAAATAPPGPEEETAASPLALDFPEYVAPEAAYGGDGTPRGDVYAVGVIAYELLSGSVPYRGTSPEETILKALFGRAARLRERVAGVPEALERAVHRALERDVARRPGTARELADALIPFVSVEAARSFAPAAVESAAHRIPLAAGAGRQLAHRAAAGVAARHDGPGRAAPPATATGASPSLRAVRIAESMQSALAGVTRVHPITAPPPSRAAPARAGTIEPTVSQLVSPRIPRAPRAVPESDVLAYDEMTTDPPDAPEPARVVRLAAHRAPGAAPRSLRAHVATAGAAGVAFGALVVWVLTRF